MLPANMETTLALNQAYQEILEQCCRRVESILVQVRERYVRILGSFTKGKRLFFFSFVSCLASHSNNNRQKM